MDNSNPTIHQDLHPSINHSKFTHVLSINRRYIAVDRVSFHCQLKDPPHQINSLRHAYVTLLQLVKLQIHRFAIKIIQTMNRKLAILILALLLLAPAMAQIFDIARYTKHGDIFKNAPCNGLTVIDFSFSSSSLLTCTSSTCTETNPSLSSLLFLDINGNQMSYTLLRAQFVTQSFLADTSQAFVFHYQTGSSFVYVAVPITTTNNATDQVVNQQIITLSTSKDPYLAGLAAVTDTTLSSGIPLSIFNFLNTRDQGRFYHVKDNSTSTTLLIAKTRFIMPTALTNPTTVPFVTNVTNYYQPYYATTGDVLCWGSTNSIGFFQTHMRESVPLWFFVLMVLFFWLYNLIGNELTPEIYETSFKRNKWTCWSLYSIYYLSHEELFTKTSRTALVLINMCWQAMIIAGIFSTLGTQNDGTIIVWATVVALVASLPVPYIYGKLVLTKVYATEKQRFRLQIQMQTQLDKTRHEQLELEQVHHQQHLYALYYGYYASIIVLLALFGALSVHTMQVFPRQFYYLHWYWLATVGATIFIDLLLLDPLLTLLIGHTDFYKARGYYYDSELAELQRKIT